MWALTSLLGSELAACCDLASSLQIGDGMLNSGLIIAALGEVTWLSGPQVVSSLTWGWKNGWNE